MPSFLPYKLWWGNPQGLGPFYVQLGAFLCTNYTHSMLHSVSLL